MTEAQLQVKVMRYLRSQGIYARKLHDSYTSGLPDVMTIIKGQAVFFELKSESGRLSLIQELEGKKIVNAGGKFFVIRTMDELKDALK